MRRKLAETYYHSPIILCPLCEHIECVKDVSINDAKEALDDAMKRMIEHLISCHANLEAQDLLGWR